MLEKKKKFFFLNPFCRSFFFGSQIIFFFSRLDCMHIHIRSKIHLICCKKTSIIALTDHNSRCLHAYGEIRQNATTYLCFCCGLKTKKPGFWFFRLVVVLGLDLINILNPLLTTFVGGYYRRSYILILGAGRRVRLCLSIL